MHFLFLPLSTNFLLSCISKIYNKVALDLLNIIICPPKYWWKVLIILLNKYFRVPEVQDMLSRGVKRLGCVCQSFCAAGEGGDESQKCNRNKPINGVVLVCITHYVCVCTINVKIITFFRKNKISIQRTEHQGSIHQPLIL